MDITPESSVSRERQKPVPALLRIAPDWRIFGSVVHCQEEPGMKGQEKKKETKKQPQKSLKEKRAEKHAKKESKV